MFKHGFPPEWSTLKKLIWLVGSGIAGAASAIWKTVTGTLLHITDALPSPVRELSVAIEPQQSGSGDPSPDNIRPITGATGCEIRHCANLLLPKYYLGTQFDGYVDKYYLASDGSLASNSSYFVSGYMPIPPNTICRRLNTNSRNLSLCFYDENKQYVSGIAYNNISAAEFTSPQNAVYVRMTAPRSSTTDTWPRIEVNYTAYPISWQTEAGEVYGGTLDVVNGVLTAKEFLFQHDNTKDWAYSSSWSKTNTAVFYLQNQTATYYPSYDSKPIVACNMFPCMTRNELYAADTEGVGLSGNVGSIPSFTLRINKSRASTVAELKTFLTNNPIKYVYVRGNKTELAPIVYQLTPTPITTLTGENNIWADANGEITLTYQAVPETAFSDNADTGMADYMTLTE